jgi:ABC-type Fe3+ transport system permease subunit
MIARARHYIPLLGFLLPTLVIAYGFVIPKSCIHGINALRADPETHVAC